MNRARITGYGPNSSEARVAEIRRVFAAYGDELERAASIAPEGAVVLYGRAVWANKIFDAGVRAPVYDYTDHGGLMHCLATVDGAELAAALTRLGREGDAVKVLNGPPDQPRPDGARLLVCLVDEICVAVTWSKGLTPPRPPIFFDARRVL